MEKYRKIPKEEFKILTKTQKSPNKSVTSPWTCFVGGIHIRIREEELQNKLKAKFSNLKIEDFKLVQSKTDPSANRGFGFLTLKTEEDYNFIINKEIVLKGKIINFRRIEATNKNHTKAFNKNRIILKKLDRFTNNHQIKSLLDQNEIKYDRCYVVKDSDSLSCKGIAVIDLNINHKQKSLEKLKSILFKGKKLNFEIYKEEKRNTIRKQKKINENGQNNHNADQKYFFKNTKRMEFLIPTRKMLINQNSSNYVLRNMKEPQVFIFQTYKYSLLSLIKS